MPFEIEKAYEPAGVEDQIYAEWEASGYFNPDTIKNEGEPFSIAMPPPNATGTLHVGHALMLVLQDIMVRHNRMQGKKALWIPGTDHASIATQNKVERILAKEGISRQDLGREAFLEHVYAYVEKSRGTIRDQIRKMGSSCDWSRERYTLDEGLSRAVSEIFVRMYADGLIYRGYRMVNWCPRCESTLADDEVEHKEESGKLYFISYPVNGTQEFVTVATTRPETMLGDVAVAVSPTDERYAHLKGATLTLPLVHAQIPLIFDDYVDPAFGTGALKITPAHDPNDLEIGKRHGLSAPSILSSRGSITLEEIEPNEEIAHLEGLDRAVARQEILKMLENKGLLTRTEDLTHSVGMCYRCDTAIEPRVSQQWFVSVDTPIPGRNASLKELSLDTVQSGKTRIVPERFEKTYFHWVNNLRDWCISRQIWFGHQLPVYYCERSECAQTIVSVEPVSSCPSCKGSVKRDEDTLDTWFSSGLWTFSTLGWPDATSEVGGQIEKEGDLKTFHPTSVLETGYDILPFWVARMILMSRYALDEAPFRTVYLHGMVLDAHGKKMSKSHEETIIDPLDMIGKYGADALRLSMIVGVTPGNDLSLGEEKVASYRNFVNKLWNIGRYILTLPEEEPSTEQTLADRWIISRLQQTIVSVSNHLDRLAFSQAAEELRSFTWDELADWYIEVSKIEKGKRALLHQILGQLLALWHPFMPFVTEKLHSYLNLGKPLIIGEWPIQNASRIDFSAIEQFQNVQGIIQAIRNARAENKISPAERIRASIVCSKNVYASEHIIRALARLSEIVFVSDSSELPSGIRIVGDGFEVSLPYAIMNTKEEIVRLTKEIESLSKRIDSIDARLSNEEFTARAPQTIVDAERQKRDEYAETLQKTHELLKALS